MELFAETGRPVWRQEFFLSAGECNPQGFMSVTLLVERLIEVATAHANRLRIGYEELHALGIGWVLSRLSVEMERWPAINERYSLVTWVSDWNRLYTTRCFAVIDGEGRTIGYARTVWVAIDMERRRAADLGQLGGDRFVNEDLQCPVAPQRKMPAVTPSEHDAEYRFAYCDLDCNGHVNTVRYIEHILNLRGPEYYAARRLQVFEIAFVHECYYGQLVQLRQHEQEDVWAVDMVREGERCVTARLTFVTL